LDATETAAQTHALLRARSGFDINQLARMKALLNDLVEFNRTRLGLGIKVTPAEVDVAKLFAEELAQLRAAYPQRRIELVVNGDCRGHWDGARLQPLPADPILLRRRRAATAMCG